MKAGDKLLCVKKMREKESCCPEVGKIYTYHSDCGMHKIYVEEIRDNYTHGWYKERFVLIETELDRLIYDIKDDV